MSCALALATLWGGPSTCRTHRLRRLARQASGGVADACQFVVDGAHDVVEGAGAGAAHALEAWRTGVVACTAVVDVRGGVLRCSSGTQHTE